MTGGNGVILRASQVSALENRQYGAMLVEPTTNLTTVKDASSASTCPSNATVTVSSSATARATGTSNNATQFTAGDMAGVGAGIGVPLLAALLGALFVIMIQRKKLRQSQEGFPHAMPTDRQLFVRQDRYVQTPSTAAPAYSSDGSEAKYYTQMQQPHQSVFREMDSQAEVRELATERSMQELGTSK